MSQPRSPHQDEMRLNQFDLLVFAVLATVFVVIVVAIGTVLVSQSKLRADMRHMSERLARLEATEHKAQSDAATPAADPAETVATPPRTIAAPAPAPVKPPSVLPETPPTKPATPTMPPKAGDTGGGDQRPGQIRMWIPRIAVGRDALVSIAFKNVEDGMVTDVRENFEFATGGIGRVQPYPVPPCRSCHGHFVHAHRTIVFSLTIPGEKFSPSVVQRLQAGNDGLMVFGRVDYRDGRGRMRSARACAYYDRLGGAMNACGNGN